MGVKATGLGLAALALAAVLLPLRKNAPDTETKSGADRSERLVSLSHSLSFARLSWSAFELRDSALQLLASAPTNRAARPVIALRGFAQGTVLRASDSIVATLWEKAGAGAPGVRISVMVYNNTPYHRASYEGAMISVRPDRIECVAIAPASVDRFGKVYDWRSSVSSAMAPCLLLSTFGKPGNAIAEWLRLTSYAGAQSNTWLSPRPASDSGRGRGPWLEWADARAGDEMQRAMYGWMERTGTLIYALQMRPPYSNGAAGLRCIIGEEASCILGVLHPAIALPAIDSLPPELTFGAWLRSPVGTTLATVRPPAPGLVASLITEFGREKFQKFWSSDQSFEAAFQSAFGESLGSWTARWAAREWRNSYEAKHGNPQFLLGVTLKPSWLAITVGWGLLALAIAAGVAKRRTA